MFIFNQKHSSRFIFFRQHKGRQHDESVFANFCQYKLDSQYLDVVVADASLPLWRDRLLVDAIITDRKLCFFSVAFGRGTSKTN